MRVENMAARRDMWVRRRFLSRIAVAVFPRSLPLLGAGPGQNTELGGTDMDLSSVQALITPNQGFFIRNHFKTPVIRAEDWRLSLTGRFHSSLEIGYQEVLRLPKRSITVTVECAGNGVGGGAVSTAIWTGIPLRELLNRAGLEPGVRFLRLTGCDQGTAEAASEQIPFARSIPIEKALHPDTILAFEMNGVPLPAEHGFPLRAIVPGWYGMDAVKWLVSIEALGHQDLSHFMTERYVATRLLAVGTERRPLNRMHVKSQITSPREGEHLPLPACVIRGAAWAGESEVSQVEVAVDGGRIWARAELEAPPQPYCWVLWKYVWTPPGSGKYTIAARATDAQGRTQPATKDRLRFDQYDNDWYHAVRCEVL
jgi:DMSO/TMAO reductase YedYZ molybdopterin-dependent catalytic subunit